MSKEIIWHDPEEPEDEVVEFRLTYAGPLRPDTRGATEVAKHKHEIRRHFHTQLRRLWEDRPHIQERPNIPPRGPVINLTDSYWSDRRPRAERLAARFQRNGYRFVPLVTDDLAMSCALEILFLRPEPPGRIIRAGDIDNRIKTLFDALKMPNDLQDFGPYTMPEEGEDPFYCLVEDDRLITSLSVETDLLLEPIGTVPNRTDARIFITVRIRPTRLTWENIPLA